MLIVYAQAYAQSSHHVMSMICRHMSASACVNNMTIPVVAGDDGCEISRRTAPINNLGSGLKPAAVKWCEAQAVLSTTPNHVSPLGRPKLAHRRYL